MTKRPPELERDYLATDHVTEFDIHGDKLTIYKRDRWNARGDGFVRRRIATFKLIATYAEPRVKRRA